MARSRFIIKGSTHLTNSLSRLAIKKRFDLILLALWMSHSNYGLLDFAYSYQIPIDFRCIKEVFQLQQ